MTDNDIIKALEWLGEIKGVCLSEDEYIYATILYDLINHQNEEIEALKIENQSLRSAANSYKIHYNEARAESVKEFAERLRERLVSKAIDNYRNDNENGYYLSRCVLDEIDSLVKEMEGDTDGRT